MKKKGGKSIYIENLFTSIYIKNVIPLCLEGDYFQESSRTSLSRLRYYIK